jgi:hypothetical protein
MPKSISRIGIMTANEKSVRNAERKLNTMFNTTLSLYGATKRQMTVQISFMQQI